MNRSKSPVILAAYVALAAASPSTAQHNDVLLQSVNLRLTSGGADFDNGRWALGQRVYANEFDSDYAVNDPGFNALAAGSPSLPAGAEALPGGAPLGWDFLPLKIDGAASNLVYWNGSGAIVDFGDLPGPDYELSLFGRFESAAVDGSPQLVPGDVINDTAANGSLHTHRFFYLDSGNNNATTTPADGIYLMAIRATMSGLDSSEPIYFVWGTPGSTLVALRAAEAWVEDRVDDLAPDFDADFDADLDVDGADFLTWQRNNGMAGALQTGGDADRDRAIAASDLAVWREQAGSSLATFPGASTPVRAVPEPDAFLLAWVAVVSAGCAIGAARSTVSSSSRSDNRLIR